MNKLINNKVEKLNKEFGFFLFYNEYYEDLGIYYYSLIIEFIKLLVKI